MEEEDLVKEVYTMDDVNKLAKKGYKIHKVYIYKEYTYNNYLMYHAVSDAYPAYIMVKDKIC